MGTRTTSGRTRRSDGTRMAASGHYRRSWIYAAAAGVVVMLAVWFTTNKDINEGGPVYARTPVPRVEPSSFSWTPASETTPASPQVEVAPAAPIVAEQPAPSAPSERVSEPAIYPRESEAALAIAPVAVITPPSPATNVPPAAAAPARNVEPEFRIKGIIYTSSRPSAIVNGRIVGLGDRVNGATVIGISQTSVTLLVKGQHKIYELP
jgi:hypothetical protein